MAEDIKPGMLRLDTGTKARQRSFVEDRDAAFSDALRQYGIPATDVDFICTNGKDQLRVMIEVTRCDNTVYSNGYLTMIDQRRREGGRGNHSDALMMLIAKRLGVPAHVVVFTNDIAQPDATVWMRHLDGNQWYKLAADRYLIRLREICSGE